jgi:hypothetical protein
MSAPFDTLKLARQFEAAGFEPKQAGDMAAAIADAQASADLATKADLDRLERATKADLRDVEQRLKIWTGSIGAALFALLFTALHLWPPK